MPRLQLAWPMSEEKPPNPPVTSLMNPAPETFTVSVVKTLAPPVAPAKTGAAPETWTDPEVCMCDAISVAIALLLTLTPEVSSCNSESVMSAPMYCRCFCHISRKCEAEIRRSSEYSLVTTVALLGEFVSTESPNTVPVPRVQIVTSSLKNNPQTFRLKKKAVNKL